MLARFVWRFCCLFGFLHGVSVHVEIDYFIPNKDIDDGKVKAASENEDLRKWI